MSDETPTLEALLENLGRGVVEVVAAPGGLKAAVLEPVIYDSLESSAISRGALVLAVGVPGGTAQGERLLAAAEQAGAAGVIFKASPDFERLADSSAVAILSVPEEMTWTQLHALLNLSRFSTATGAAGVAGVPLGDLFALANAIAGLVGGAVTIEDPARAASSPTRTSAISGYKRCIRVNTDHLCCGGRADHPATCCGPQIVHAIARAERRPTTSVRRRSMTPGHEVLSQHTPRRQPESTEQLHLGGPTSREAAIDRFPLQRAVDPHVPQEVGAARTEKRRRAGQQLRLRLQRSARSCRARKVAGRGWALEMKDRPLPDLRVQCDDRQPSFRLRLLLATARHGNGQQQHGRSR